MGCKPAAAHEPYRADQELSRLRHTNSSLIKPPALTKLHRPARCWCGAPGADRSPSWCRARRQSPPGDRRFPTRNSPCASVAPTIVSARNTRPGHQHRHRAWPMIAARILVHLGVRPNSPERQDQGVIEQPAFVEVADQPGDALVELLHEVAAERLEDLGVMVPAAVVDRDETDAHFHQTPGEQHALARDRCGRSCPGPWPIRERYQKPVCACGDATSACPARRTCRRLRPGPRRASRW